MKTQLLFSLCCVGADPKASHMPDKHFSLKLHSWHTYLKTQKHRLEMYLVLLSYW